jgi:very-short-patch-repair endonuclease
MRLLLRSRGLAIRSQVDLSGIGRVDLLIDEWLVVEVDSRAHHGSPADQDRDRQRDGTATLRGYATLRFMAMDVAHRPEWCLAVVGARLRSGRPTMAARGGGVGM